MHECFKFVVIAVQTRLGIKKDCCNHAYVLNILISKKRNFLCSYWSADICWVYSLSGSHCNF